MIAVDSDEARCNIPAWESWIQGLSPRKEERREWAG